LPDSFARNLPIRVIGRSWYGAPQGTSISCPELFLQPVAKLRPPLPPFAAAPFTSRDPRFHSGTPLSRPPILCISAMVSARFRLIAPFTSWTCAPRARLWIVATVQSQQPSANQRVRNLHHEGTVSRAAPYTLITGGFGLDLLGCISARLLQLEGTLFLS
jgi:hypothetical protein